MITAGHVVLYTPDAVAARAFFRDVLGWSHVDADGDGWLIFKTPPSEMGVHPTQGDEGQEWAKVPHHNISLMCDDIQATIAELRAKGVEVSDEVVDQGYGLVTSLEVPGAGQMMLYEPRYPPAYDLEG